MSDAKLIGSCGIRFTENANGDGSLAEFAEWAGGGEERFTLAREDDGDEFDMTRDEVRDLLPLLTAFANGAP